MIKIFKVTVTRGASDVEDEMNTFMESQLCTKCSYSIMAGYDYIILDYYKKDHEGHINE